MKGERVYLAHNSNSNLPQQESEDARVWKQPATWHSVRSREHWINVCVLVLGHFTLLHSSGLLTSLDYATNMIPKGIPKPSSR